MTEPLVPAEVCLKDFMFMPLDVVRLRDADVTVIATGDEFRAAVLLWCASWHQTPAASLPNDDRVLANMAGYGRDIEAWKQVKNMAIRGFVECSDGRLYHPVIAEKAVDSWNKKQAQRQRTAAANAARNEQRNDDRNVHQVKGSKVKVSKGIQEKDSAEPQAARAPFITIPLNSGDEFPIHDDQIAEWGALFPAVDIRQELRNIRAWGIANPTKRKTKTGIIRHVTSWLSAQQNSPRKPNGASHAGTKPADIHAAATAHAFTPLPNPVLQD